MRYSIFCSIFVSLLLLIFDLEWREIGQPIGCPISLYAVSFPQNAIPFFPEHFTDFARMLYRFLENGIPFQEERLTVIENPLHYSLKPALLFRINIREAGKNDRDVPFP